MISKINASTMKNGLILGAVLAAIFLLSTNTYSFTAIIANVLFIYSFFIVYRMTVRFREMENDGIISYKHSLLYIVFLFLYASLVSGIVVLVYCKFLVPDYLASIMENEEIKQLMSALAKQMNVSQQELNQSIDLLMTPVSYTMQYIWGHIFLGIFTGLIMSVFIKKTSPPIVGE